MYATGRGRVVMRAQVAFEEIRAGRMAVVVTELPYQVNKTTLIEKMAELVSGKRITDVSDIRDESDRTGMRIVVEVKRDGSPHTVMQQLFKHTALQTSFNANMLALVDGQPDDPRPQADARALHRLSARGDPAADASSTWRGPRSGPISSKG